MAPSASTSAAKGKWSYPDAKHIPPWASLNTKLKRLLGAGTTDLSYTREVRKRSNLLCAQRL